MHKFAGVGQLTRVKRASLTRTGHLGGDQGLKFIKLTEGQLGQQLSLTEGPQRNLKAQISVSNTKIE